MAKKQFNATGGLSVGNIISPISVIDANGVINTPANITGNYYFGNGAFLTGINAGNIEGSYGNANVAAYLASNSNIDIAIGTGNITTRGNVSADYFIGNGAGLTAVRANGNNFQIQYNKNNLLSTDNQFYYDDANAGALYINYTGGGSLWTDDIISSNSVTALGPASIGGNVVTFENFVGNGYYITALEYSNINNAYSNTNAAAYLASNANVTIITTGNIVTAANVSANYVIGNGAFLTGLAAGYSNADVANYLASNANINILIGTGNVTTQGNVAANNFVGTAGSNIELIAGSSTWTFDNTGNLTLPSNSVDIYYANGDPINLEGNYSNANAAAYLGIFNGNILAGNLEVSNNAVINGNLTVLGTTTTINANTLNISDKDIVIANGATTQAQANGAGLIIGSNIANILYSDVANAMIFSGNVTTAANIQAGYVLGNGRFLSGLPEAYSNANVAAYLPTYTGNISAGNINATGNISANYFIGNGSQLTDLIATANLTVSNTAPLNATQGDLWIQANTGIQYFYFTTPAGNSQWAEMEAATSFSSSSAEGNGNYGNSNVANYLPTYTGNVSAGNVLVTSNVNLGGNINLTNLDSTDWGRIFTGNSGIDSFLALEIGDDAPGQADKIVLQSHYWVNNTRTQMLTAQMVSNTSANVSITGNVVASENVYANANVQGDYILGNGYYLTGISGGGGSYGNANVAAYLPTYTGAINSLTGNVTTTANVQGAYVLGNGAFLTGISGGSGNYSNANVAAYLPTYTGTIGATTVTATGNVNGDNINGVIRPTAGSGEAGIMFPTNIGGGSGDSANIKYYIVTGQDTVLELQVTDNSADKIYLNASGGTNVATSLNVSGGITGTTINGTTVTGTSFVGNGSALFGVKYANITGAYGNSNVAAYLPDYTGNLNINGLTVSGIANLGPAGNVKISGGNLNYYLTSDGSGGLAWAAGTSNITGNGSVAGADQQIQYNNGTGNFAASAALRFDYTSNTLIVGGNLSVANINATGNIFGINEDQVAIAVMGNEWTFTQDAYLNLPVNFFAVRYANGANVILGDTYSNSAVSNYLGSNSSVTILTTGNITGGYILGNGRFLTGITAYTNANVAGYLQTYNANALFGNVTVSQDAIIQGNLTVLGSTNYNNTTNSIIDAYRVIVANSANTISQLNGAGLQIGNLASGNVEFIYDYTANIMTLSHGANIANILNVSGNTSATYFLGNGRFLSGLGENYSNADVSGFLPIYGGNVRADYTISNVIYSGNILPMYSNTTLANSTVDIGSETYFFSNVYGNKFTVPAGAAGNNSAIQSGENYDGFMFVDTVTGQLASLEAGDAYFGNLTIYSDFEIGNNLQVVGNVNCLSNVTAINFIGNGSALFGIQYSNIIGTYSNSNAAAYLPTYTGNLVSLTGNVTTSANIRSNYNIANLTRTGNILPIYSNAVLANNFVDIGSAQYQFRNIYADKLVTPSGVTGNATEIQSSTSGSGIAFIDSGSGQLAAISAGDSSFTGNVEVDGFIQADQYIQATGNIIAGGNVTGSYILGNGAFLTGIDAGNIVGGYGNSQVAAYLQVYNGNASFSNVTVSRDMVVLGNLRVEGNTTEINVSNIFLADKDIIVAANATATLADLDGAGIQIGNRTAGGNITFFYDSTSNVMELSHGANISNRLEVSGNISGSNINGVIRPTAGSGEAGIIFPANPGGGTGDLASIKYYASAGENTVLELNVNNDSTDTIYLNASGGTNVATSLTVAGNIVGGNITTAANISAGNLSVVNIQVTEIDITGGALTINATGDIVTTGNLQVINIDVNDINVGGNALTINTTGDIVTTGNLQVVDIDVTNINVGSNALTINATGDIVTTGNLQVNNVDVNVINLDQGTITSNVTQVSIAAGNRTWIYETSGNLLLPGNIVPGANSNNTLDIGSSGTQFRRVYANNYVTPVGTSGGPTLIQSNPIGSGIALIDFVSGLPTQIYGNGFITPSGVTGNATLIRSSTTGRGISFVDNNTGLLVPISASESILSGNLTANGYIFGGNLNIGSGALTINILGDIVTTGNIQVNDLDVNDLVALGNITGTYILGNGAFLTGISGGSGNYSNANVDSYLASNAAVTILTTANITTAANVSGSYILGNGAFLTGISGGSGSYGNANVANYLASNAAVTILTTGNITTTANVSANNIVGSGTNTTITTNGYRWSFNNAGNLVLPGNTFAINYANGTQVSLGGSSSYSNANVAAYLPTYTGAIDSLGGNVTTTANVTGNFLIGNIRSATGGYNDANVAAYTGALTNLTGNVTTTANVSGAYILGNGYFVSGIQYSNIIGAYSNTNVANYLASNANVTILTTGNITTTANITANNFIGSEVNTSITADAYVWTFNNTGNLVLPSNTFAINYANGTQVSLGGNFSNANVANYLASGSLTSNIITTGNVSGNYILGNGALLTGLPATYSNANVANYLPTYTGNLVSLTGNVTTTANVQGAFLLGNIRSATGGYNDANVTSYLASNANISITVQGNVSANNFTIGSGTLLGNNPNTTITTGSYSWVFSDNGNLVLPGNTLAVNFANGVSITTSLYSNANAASYLPTYTGNLASLTGNVITTGDISSNNLTASNVVTAEFFYGDGIGISNLQLFGLTSNISTTGNVTAGNYFGNIRNTTGGYGDANVATYLPTYTGNGSFGNLQVTNNVVILGNLQVLGNTTTINANTLSVNDKDIIVANNAVTADELDGAGLQIGNLASGNIQFFYNFASNVMTLNRGLTVANNLSVLGNIIGPAGNMQISAGNMQISASNILLVAGSSTLTFNTAGNVTGSNNITANYYYGDISNTTGGYGNNSVTGFLGSNSFVPIITAGQIVTQANLSAEYLYGNGYFLTGIASNYSNANVAAYLQEFPGNIIPAANGAYNLGNNTRRWNDVYVNNTLYLPFQTLTSNSTRIIASSSLSAYDFISTNDITAAANITATGNVSGSYVLGNIRFSTGGYNDANVAAYTGALTNLTGNVTTTANVQGAYVLGNIRSATGGYDDANVAAYTGALTNLTGNVTTTANLQGAYVLGNGAFLTGIAAGYSNADVANYLPTYTGALPNLTGNVVTTANVQGGYILGNGYFLSGISGGGGSTYGNANVSDYLASNAAITVLTTANITTAANVAGTYFIGNGAFLTGISAGSSYSNANVADYLASNAAVTITTTANISSSTNVNAGNFSGTGVNTNIRTGSQLWTFGSTGTLTIPGNVNANNYYINNLTNPVQDQDAATKIYVDNLASTAISYHEAVLAATTGTLADATGGTITYNQVNGVGNGIGATLTTTGSFNLIDTANVQTANTRILVKNEANGAHNGVYVWSNATAITRAPMENTAGVANVDAFGINDYFYTTGGNINKGSAFIVDSPNTAIVFGTSNIQFAVFSQSQVYSANTAAGISLATTTISAKVDNDTTAFDGGGNISVKAGANLVTPNIGAATGTSLNVTGNITSSANISAANFVGGSASNTTIRTGVYNWTFGNTGNFTLPGNTFAVNYANGAQVALGSGGGSYSNADVANYLASNAAVTILTTGNITTSANITANNFIGAAGSDPNVGLIAGTYTWNFDNTGNLTLPGNTFAVNYANGTQISLYGNSNVATYLASNAAVTVLTTANITTTANVAGNYFIGNGAFLTGIAGGGGSYGNSNVATYLASNAAVTILTTANITSAANVAAGNFVGSASNTTIKTGAFTWTFDAAGNLNINSANGTIVGSNANTTIQTGANRWNFASDGVLYLPGNIVAGYRDIPQNSWTGTPTIALADLGEHYYTASGGVTINIPANSSVPLPIGAAVTLVNQSGANCTIGANAGVTLYLAGNATTGNRTLAWYGFATLVKVATDTWFVNGSNVI